jgi:AsmA family protein
MNKTARGRGVLRRAGIVGGLVALVVVVFALLFEWNWLRPPVAWYIAARTGRPVSIDGNLSVHLWSWQPELTLQELAIGNPPWARHAVMLQVDRLTISMSIPRLLRGELLLPRIDIVKPVLYLERDARDRASWNLGSVDGVAKSSPPLDLPAFQHLLISDGSIRLHDEIRKLQFTGTLAADERSGAADQAAFRFDSIGTINGRPFKLHATGGPLVHVDRDKPYPFAVTMTAGQLSLAARTSILRPFNLGVFESEFTISGPDLADLYYFTGLALPISPPYELSGTLRRHGDEFRIADLHGRLGRSDLSGELTVVTGKTRAKLTAQLKSENLYLADLAVPLGVQPQESAAAASSGMAPPKPASPADSVPARMLLLPDVDLRIDRLLRMDADVTYAAASVTTQKIPMRAVHFHLLLNDGLLRMDPLTFVLPQGIFSGTVSIDALAARPRTDIDMKVDHVSLGQFKPASAGAAPLEGVLMGRLKIHGSGTSVHKLAATADGTLALVMPSGEIREVLAEFTGIDVLHALGILLTRAQSRTDVRCGVAEFRAHAGMLEANTVVIDTTNVFITGRGDLAMDTEILNLSLQGRPKKFRILRLRSPITVRGTLSNPTLGLKAAGIVGQSAVGTLLGVIVAPLAAVIAFVDVGLAKDANCAALIADAGQWLHAASAPR